jgi:hypothetical protein
MHRHHRWRMVAVSLLSLFLMPFILLYCLGGSLRNHLPRHGDQPYTIRKAYHLSGLRTSASPSTVDVPSPASSGTSDPKPGFRPAWPR